MGCTGIAEALTRHTFMLAKEGRSTHVTKSSDVYYGVSLLPGAESYFHRNVIR